MDSSKIRIAGKVDDSIVDGPGIRYTIFFQGCPHHCPGCHNPETHDFNGGHFEEIADIVKEIKKNPLLLGVTISGGEPFSQKEQLLSLVKKIKELNLNIMVYTGYTFEYLINLDSVTKEILSSIDYLVDGPFILKERDLELIFRGSRNQRYIDVKKTLKENKIILVD